MKKVEQFVTVVYRYNSSSELTDHKQDMYDQGWSVITFSYTNLRARYRRTVRNSDEMRKL